MQFRVDVKQVESGWKVVLLDPATGQSMPDPGTGKPILASPRLLQRLDVGPDSFPLPPASGPDGLPVGLAQEDLPDAFQNVLNQSAGPRGVEIFGRYLFNTLLGAELWATIDRVAGKKAVELALTWAADDGVLNRLPWEIMHTGREDNVNVYEGFLAAEPEVFITRRVAGTADERYRVQSLPSPPKVLFVIGSNLTDPVIRPGAEYLGLLKHLEQSGRQLHTKLLVGATTTMLSEAIKSFRPSVVHVVCHGVITEDGPRLEFRREPGSREPDYVDAARLALVLKTDKDLPLPQVVVLNACSTASSDELTVGRPLAAELVQLGVPIVVGMAGKVADQACRLFTRGFYGALLAGGDVAAAAAKGRRAAIAHGGYDPRTQVDWALPCLFLAEAVGEAALDIQVDDDALQRLRQAAEFSKRPDYPAFCGRWDFFELYRDLMSRSQHQFLAVSVPRSDTTNDAAPQPQYGSTRLLKELAAEAMRDGHIPILVSKEWLGQKNWPSTLASFLDAIVKAVNHTTQILAGVARHRDLASAWDWKYLPRFKDAYPNDAPTDDLPDEFRRYGLTPEERLAKAFILDLLSLRQIVCAQRGENDDADVKVVLLVDDAHQLVFSESFFTLLGSYGLRDARAVATTRCVITYNEKPVDGQNTAVMTIKDWANSHDVRPVPLGLLHNSVDPTNPLANPENFQQAALIYKHFLLHWRRDNQKHALSIVARDDAPGVRKLITGLAYTAGGVPSGLCQKEVSAIIFYDAYIEPAENRVLRAADDEAALADLDQILRKRG